MRRFIELRVEMAKHNKTDEQFLIGDKLELDALKLEQSIRNEKCDEILS